MTKTNASPRIPASLLRSLLYYVRSKGFDTEKLCQELDIPQKVLENPDEEVGLSTFNAAWEHAERLTGDPYIGLHLGQAHDLSAIGVVGYLLQSSKTLGQAVENLCCYHSLISDILKLTSGIQSNEMHIAFTPHQHAIKYYPSGTRRVVETAMAFASKFLPGLVCTEMPIRRVMFAFLPPAEVKEYEAVFTERISFDQQENAIVYDAKVRTLPIATFNPSLFALFENHANGLIKRLEKRKNVSSRTQVIMMKNIRDRNLTINKVAAELFMTPRTLQRRLEEEDTSYQALIDEVRADLARNYLQDLGLSGTDTAFLLGFSEPSAFVKSFRRWTGMSPTEYKTTHTNIRSQARFSNKSTS